MNLSKIGRGVLAILVLVSLFYRINRTLARNDSDWQERQEREEQNYRQQQQMIAPVTSELAKLRADEVKVAADYCTAYKAMPPKEQKSEKAEALRFAKELIDPTARQNLLNCVEPQHKAK